MEVCGIQIDSNPSAKGSGHFYLDGSSSGDVPKALQSGDAEEPDRNAKRHPLYKAYPKFTPPRDGSTRIKKGLKGVSGNLDMSPEETLAEFISTSAAFHKVSRQDIKSLEWDLLDVFENNVMPANAAAWYVAKRRYHMAHHLSGRLLPQLLENHPDKFAVNSKRNEVKFLEKYTKDAARSKLQYLVHYGLFAYFSHKVDEYGVYFFDPLFYETREPFRTNLMLATGFVRDKKKLSSYYFRKFKSQFHFVQHSEYLASISRKETQIVVNCFGVIRSMLNRTQGIIEFKSSSGVERAIFSIKALFQHGYPLRGNPEDLSTVKFDGYKIPCTESSESDFTWCASLVWIGKKPSPKFCANGNFLMNSFSHQDKLLNSKEDIKSQDQPLPTLTAFSEEYLLKGKVLGIQKNGAIAQVEAKDEERILIPGWSAKTHKQKEEYLSLPSGDLLFPGDQVTFYVDRNRRVPEFSGIALNTIVLTRANPDYMNSMKRMKADSSSEFSGKALYKLQPKEALIKFLLEDELNDLYDSDEDPSFIPPPIYETDLDYDEYSECEIGVDEKDLLMKESDENFDYKSLVPENSQEVNTKTTSKTKEWIKLLLDGELAEEDPKDSDYELPLEINKNLMTEDFKRDDAKSSNEEQERNGREEGQTIEGYEDEEEVLDEELQQLLKESGEPLETVLERMKTGIDEEKI